MKTLDVAIHPFMRPRRRCRRFFNSLVHGFQIGAYAAVDCARAE